MTRRPALALALWMLALAVAAPALAQPAVDSAEACWRQRSRGFAVTATIDREAVRCAVERLREAAQVDPRRLELALRRIEALWFAAHFGAGDGDERRAWLDEAVAVADAAVAEVTRQAGGREIDATRPEQVAALRAVPAAGAVHFFAAVAWGEWGMQRGWLASASNGVAGRLRRHAELAAQLAPELRAGGGLRLLGRLHATLPRLPLVTSWVDRRRGLELLRQAIAVSRDDPRNALFLAEAILDQEPRRRDEARALLEELAARSPAAEELVEQSETLATARALLARLRAEEKR